MSREAVVGEAAKELELARAWPGEGMAVGGA
jgi:hypothetical protein